MELCQKQITRNLTAKIMNTHEVVTENFLSEAEDVGVLGERGIWNKTVKIVDHKS